MSIKQAKIFTITSVKGGVGKTTTTLNLAGMFSKQKKSVLIIDLDLYSGGITTSLNISNETDIFKLVDDMGNNRFNNVDDYVVSYNEYIKVMPAPKDPRTANKISAKYLKIIIDRFSMKYDFILIDTNHFINDINLTILDESDKILYLISNDPVDLKNMKSMISILKSMEKSNYIIVLNESFNKETHYFSKYDIKNIIKDNVDYIIPSSFFLKNIDKYVLDGKILTLDNLINKKHNKTIKVYESIISNLMKEEKVK